MIKVTVIKSPAGCNTCEETGKIVEEVSANFEGMVEVALISSDSPEATSFGVITTPVVAIDNKIYSMGKPVIKEKVTSWIRRELGSAAV